MAKQRNELRYRIERRNDTTWIALSGNLNEGSDFTPLKKLPGPIVLDLGDIGRINSMGVRDWIHFVRDYELAGVSLTFERCAPVIVSQMGMISNFMGLRSRVASILVPYQCPACHAEHNELVETGPGVVIEATTTCPKCKSTMNLDEPIEMYSVLKTG